MSDRLSLPLSKHPLIMIGNQPISGEPNAGRDESVRHARGNDEEYRMGQEGAGGKEKVEACDCEEEGVERGRTGIDVRLEKASGGSGSAEMWGDADQELDSGVR
jgi:hypothetical protein